MQYFLRKNENFELDPIRNWESMQRPNYRGNGRPSVGPCEVVLQQRSGFPKDKQEWTYLVRRKVHCSSLCKTA